MEIYTYTPLNLDEPSFRLVRLFGGVGRELQCELIHALLKPSDVMDYEAVSYTWGVVPHPVSFLEIHGETIKKLPIHYNLYRVLLDLRLVDEDRMLWIDAICINQGTQDATERNHQVQQMAEIYKTAQRVLVWLGPSTQEMDLAMVSLLEFQSLFKEMKWKAEEIRASDTWKRFESSASREHDDPRYLGIKKIFNQPWFRRIWVLQEVGNARAVIIHCGKKAVSSATFLLAPSVYQIEVDKHCQAVLDLMPASSARSQHGGQYRDLRKLLRDFRGAEATREHDKVYALLGLCHGKGKDLRISYEKPISEVISEVISHICYYEVGSTPVPLYKSIREFQSDLDDLEDKVLQMLARNGFASNLRSILERRDIKFTASEEFLKTVARIGQQSRGLFDLIFQRFEGLVNITTGLIMAAIASHDEKCLEIIIERAEQRVITKEVVEAAIRTPGRNAEILGLIIQRVEESMITEDILIAAIHIPGGIDKLLRETLQDAPWEVYRKAATIARHDADRNERIFNTVLQRAKKSVVTKRVLLAAIDDPDANDRIINAIIQRTETSVLTEKVIIAATRASRKNDKILHIIFRWAAEVGINWEMVMSAIRRRNENSIRLKSLDAKFWTTIMGDGGGKGKILNIILQRAKGSEITEEVLKAVVDELHEYETLMTAFVERYISGHLHIVLQKVKGSVITERVLIVAVRKLPLSSELVKVILRAADNSAITEKLVITIIQHGRDKTLLDMIFERAEKSVNAEEIITTALGTYTPMGRYATKCFMGRCQPIRITRKMVLSLVTLCKREHDNLLWEKGRCSEVKLLQFLLDSGQEIQLDVPSTQKIYQSLEQNNSNFSDIGEAVVELGKTASQLKRVDSKEKEQVSRLEFKSTSGVGLYGDVFLESILQLAIEYYIDCPSGAANLWQHVSDQWKNKRSWAGLEETAKRRKLCEFF